MYTLGYSFKPWKEPKAIADGAVDPAVRPATPRASTASTATSASATRSCAPPGRRADARWTVEAERAGTARPCASRCNFLFMCSGYYRYDDGYTPHFAGSERFAGRIVHPQHWPEDLDYAGKRVVVIGSGATAVTLVPAMAKTAAHVTMLQRSPTYVVARPVRGRARQRACGAGCRRRLAYALTRWKNVLLGMYFYSLCQRKPEHGEGAAARRRARLARPGLRRRHALHAALQPLGPAAVPGARRRPLPAPSARARPRSSPTRSRRFTETGMQAEVGRGARGRPHRHRHRPEAAGAGRRCSSASTAEPVDLPQTRELQGHDVQRRAEPGVRRSATPTRRGR